MNADAYASLSPVVAKMFRAWIGPETWYTGHPLDTRRFYFFVHAVRKFARRPIDESELSQLIIETRRGDLAQDVLERKAQEYASLYVHLLDFAEAKRGY